MTTQTTLLISEDISRAIGQDSSDLSVPWLHSYTYLELSAWDRITWDKCKYLTYLNKAKAELEFYKKSFFLQMFWCWWRQGWRQSLTVILACRRMTLLPPVSSLRLTPCLAPPMGWRGPSLATVWPVNCQGAPAVDILPAGLLCSHLSLSARRCLLIHWSWIRTAGTAGCQKQRPEPQAQVSVMLSSRALVKTTWVCSSPRDFPRTSHSRFRTAFWWIQLWAQRGGEMKMYFYLFIACDPLL